MPLPANITTVTVSHKQVAIGGAAMQGTVTWTSTVAMVDAAAETTVNASSVRATLDADGAWSVTVPVVDDPDTAPTGWTYTVVMDLTDPLGVRQTLTYNVQVTASMAPTVDWGELVEVSPVTESSPYARLALANTFIEDQTFAKSLQLGDPASLPAADPSGGGTLYADGGVLTWRSSGGTKSLSKDQTNVKDRGAVGDGVTNDTVVIQAAVTGGGLVHIPAGTYLVTASISVPSDTMITGTAGTVIKVPAGFNFAAFDIDGKQRVSIRDLAVNKTAGAVAGSDGVATLIRGNAADIRIVNVATDGMSSGFYVAGQLGTVAGTAKRIVLDRCAAANSNQFGYNIDDCDGVELTHCTSTVSVLDGVKLRKKTKNVTVTGGYYTGSTGGDGMDAFAGGDTFTVQGTVFAGNVQNGLTVKSDSLTRDDPANYGYVRSVNITGVLATNNQGSGIACHRGSGEDPTMPLVSGVNIVGCQLNGNTNWGLYLNARRATATAVSAARNGLDGIYLEPGCLDVDLVGCHAAGNSVTTSGAADGIRIHGSRIRVIGGSSLGTDPDGARSDADVAAGTKTQRYGLRVESGASEVDVFGLVTLYNLTAGTSDLSTGGIRVPGPTANVNYLDTGGKYVVPGGIRSTCTLLSAVECAVPIWLGSGGTVVRIGCEVTTAGTAGTVIRLGIRQSAEHVPAAVLGEATVAGDAIASVEATVSINVPSAGLYWLTATAQNTGATLPIIRGTTGNLHPVWSGSLSTALSASALAGYQTTATVSGALPATYTISNRLAAAPLIAIRI